MGLMKSIVSGAVFVALFTAFVAALGAPDLAAQEVAAAQEFEAATLEPGDTASFFRRGRFSPPRPPAQIATCAGIRGNGQNLFAHFGVLARQVEEYGPVTCAAGGSSGSITTFILESIWVNQDVHFCGPYRVCRRLGRDARISLMLKSFVGLSQAGIFEDIETITTLLEEVQNQQILERMNGPNPIDGVMAFVNLLRDVGPLINQDVISLLLTSPDPVFHATDIIDGLQKGLQFIVDDPRVFLRTSVINFEEVADLIGVYGSFYAGYGPADRRGMRAWMRACARPGLGLTWEQTAALPGPRGTTCGETLVDLFNAYRERFAQQGGRNRVNDQVGEFLPVFGVTGVLTGDAIDVWREARAAWLAAEPMGFEPDFADVGVGYWGNPRELARMARRLRRRFDDLGAMQFTPLGATTWREVLAASPAEPGFSPAVLTQSGALSVGGWADPLRILPLEALGARATIAVNRRDGVGSFTLDITRLLNATEDDIDALYSTTDPESTFSISLGAASGVWCTDWDGQGGVPNLLFNDAFSSPLITDFRRFFRPRFGYDNVGADIRIDGCNPARGY